MPRYFFHVLDGDTSLDGVGLDLHDLAAARNEAIRACGEMVRDIPDAICNGNPWQMWVTDEPNGEGKTLFILNVSSVLV